MKMAGCLPLTESLLKRRHFLRTGCLSLLSMSLSQYLEAKSVTEAAGVNVDKIAKAQSCILVWLEGGPSQVDTWDPKANSSFKAISTNVPGIQISELLPRTARQMDKLSLIRSVRFGDTLCLEVLTQTHTQQTQTACSQEMTSLQEGFSEW